MCRQLNPSDYSRTHRYLETAVALIEAGIMLLLVLVLERQCLSKYNIAATAAFALAVFLFALKPALHDVVLPFMPLYSMVCWRDAGFQWLSV